MNMQRKSGHSSICLCANIYLNNHNHNAGFKSIKVICLYYCYSLSITIRNVLQQNSVADLTLHLYTLQISLKS